MAAQPNSIQHILAQGELRPSASLNIPETTIADWNQSLGQLFENEDNLRRWNEIFVPSFHLYGQEKLYQLIF